MIKSSSPSRRKAPPKVPAPFQEELEPAVKDYIAALANQHPFSKEIKIEGKTLLTNLSEFWPDIPEWSGQSFEVWNKINDHILHVPGGEHGAILQIEVSSNSLCPNNYQGDEVVGYISFDSINGVLQHHPAVAQGRPTPQRLQIPAGLMVIYRLLAPQDAGYVDGIGVDGELYQTRQLDPNPEKDKSLKKLAEPPATLLPAVLLPFIPSGTMAEAASVLGESRLSALLLGAISATDIASELKKEATLRKARTHAQQVAPLAMQIPLAQQQMKKVIEKRLMAKQRRQANDERRMMTEDRRQNKDQTKARYIGEDGKATAIHERRGQKHDRRESPHERRAGMHERRRPERMGYFGMDNTGTYGLAPAEREYLARQQQRMPEPGKTWTIKNWEDQQRQERIDAEQKLEDEKIVEQRMVPTPTG